MVKQIQMTSTGSQFSQFVQGYWRLAEWGMTQQQRLTFIKQHLELGIDTVDHADIYGGYQCEQLFGEALALEPSLREQLTIVTKCDIKLTAFSPAQRINYYDCSAAHIEASVNNSLQRLGIEQIDTLLIHRPDYLMNADEVAQVFDALHQAGKVASFGVSNFTPSQFDLLQSRLDAPLVTNQVEINPVNMQVLDDGTLDQMQQYRIHPMAWSCLAGGEIFTGQSEQHLRLRQTLQIIADAQGATLDQIIYAWILAMPSQPLPIIGSGNIDRVKQAVAASRIELTREQWYEIWVASKGHGVP
ncbi:Oxidoreductase YdhF [Vibrio stylophorae]|uniref:Oxidoreductase YdhF n=2 Tax=Vibrio stylophorae TaxID=659351 RepID=A0ABN8DY53_9VIBR|nr:Oxidoreductase YdhF [Vibrio stylophorae]